MAKAASAIRVGPLDGREAKAEGVMLSPASPARRLALRAPSGSLAALGKALGLTLPRKPKGTATAGARTALWLGPDEWLVIDASDVKNGGGDPVGDCAEVSALHSAVDISHRNTAILVEGPAARATLSAGCPQDLSAKIFPVGACSRTVLGKIEVVILRTGEDAFRVECWRSFSDYAWDFLSEAARDAAN